MGQLMDCALCGRAVLELEGQFELLQPYIAEAHHAAAEIAGEVHSACLVASPHGPIWADWQARSFRVRGYREVARGDDWTVLRSPNQPELFAVHASGRTVAAQARDSGLEAAEGGCTLVRQREAHISLPDRSFVAAVQASLVEDQRVPIGVVIRHLDIEDALIWPGVLDDGEYALARPLRKLWTATSFSATARYRKFLPTVAVQAWRTLDEG